MSQEEEVVENEEVTEEETQEEKETAEQELERLRNEQESWKKKEEEYLREKSALGRRYKELQEGQETTRETIRALQETVNSLRQPKESSPDYIDLSDPDQADKWFKQKVTEYEMTAQEQQKKYADQYDKEVKKLLDRYDDEEEKKQILEGLRAFKDTPSKFGDAYLDAENNIREARLKYLEERAYGNTNKKINLKGDKAVHTGVGGGESTVSTITRKTKSDSPEVARLKGFFEQQEKTRGW